MPSSKMQNTPPPKKGVLQANNHLHVAIMKDVTQAVRRSPMPKGRIPRKHPIEVKQPLNKPSPMCKSITDHLACANPSRTIQGLIIHHVP
jgi:hypothetical protein